MVLLGSGAAQPFFDFSIFRVGSPPVDPITIAASLRLAHLINHRFSIHLHLHSYFKDIWCCRDRRFNSCHLAKDAFSSTWSACLCFFDGGDSNAQSFKSVGGMSNWNVSTTNPPNTRKWTNILLALNVIIFMAQLGTQGKLLLWGAKINHLINKGQLWRLATSSFLHANVGHLMVNCYSLNSVGPAMEKIGGARRFLAVYFASAVASSATSYWFCKAPAVGASGAIFGLVGSFAVFILRHRSMFGGGNEELQQIVRIIGLNMVLGLMSKGIDNWGHIGGLVGGAATAWLLGPAWKYEYSSMDGGRIFSDKAPIFNLISTSKGS